MLVGSTSIRLPPTLIVMGIRSSGVRRSLDTMTSSPQDWLLPAPEAPGHSALTASALGRKVNTMDSLASGTRLNAWPPVSNARSPFVLSQPALIVK